MDINIKSSSALQDLPADRDNSSQDTAIDPKYLSKSHDLITDYLKRGCDVLQMPNGDVIVTEVKTVTSRYIWDEKKEKMIKVASQVEASSDEFSL